MNFITLISYGITILVPAVAIWLIWELDIFKTGKLGTVLISGAWGAVGGFGLALLTNQYLLLPLLGIEGVKSLGAPIVEELFKALVLIYFIRQPSFRYSVDGAVYGFAAGIGFAVSENMLVYLPRAGGAVLVSAISRVLSTCLMHATTSGLVGIALGRLRRTQARRGALSFFGIGVAVLIHVVYNNVVNMPSLQGVVLLLIAIGMGLGGGVVIAMLIGQELADQKNRFRDVLGVGSDDVSVGERKAVQRLGGAAAEKIFASLREEFDEETTAQIRRLLALQGNIGILRSNLRVPVSDRLRAAWEEEIRELEAEVNRIRKQLGRYVKPYLESLFPPGDAAMWEALDAELGESDPTLVHTFDMFMRVSELAQSFTPEQLQDLAERLSKIGIFKNVSLANLENLCRAVSIAQYREGDTLFRKGDAGDAMYLVESGTINIYAQDQEGNEKLLRVFEPGSVVGEFSLLDGQPRSAGARAGRDLTVLVLTRQIFMMFISSRPQVIYAMLQYLADKVRYTTEAVQTGINAALKIAQGRYAAVPEFASASAAPEVPAVELAPENLSENTPRAVGGMFARLADVLQRRENERRRTGSARLDRIE